MSLNHSPKIVTDGLVLYYDMANKKSFPGKPTTNLLAANGGDTAMERASAVYGYYPVDITAQVQAQWSAGNNVMTFSFEGKKDRMDGGYPCGYVYFSDWSWAFAGGPSSLFWTAHQSSGTMPDPTGKTVYFNIYHMSAGFPGLSYSRNHQLEWGAYATGYTSGTRSNTGAVVDLTNKTTLEATSLTYASDNTFSFNGTSDRITQTAPNLPTGAGDKTVLCWVRPDSTGPTDQYTGLLGYGGRGSTTPSDSILLSMYTSGTTMYVSAAFWNNDFTPNNLPVTANAWNMVGLIAKGAPTTNNVTLLCGNSSGINYVTGNSSNYSRGLNTTSTNLCIGCTDGVSGGRYFKGKIPQMMVFNRSLSTSEISQIFNATRGRYGV